MEKDLGVGRVSALALGSSSCRSVREDREELEEDDEYTEVSSGSGITGKTVKIEPCLRAAFVLGDGGGFMGGRVMWIGSTSVR